MKLLRQTITVLMSGNGEHIREYIPHLDNSLYIITGIAVTSSSNDSLAVQVFIQRNTDIKLVCSFAAGDISKGLHTMVNIPIDKDDHLLVRIPAGVDGEMVTADFVGYELERM